MVPNSSSPACAKNSRMPAKDNRPSATGTVRSYAIRRVNPFLGALQVIDTGGGRAVSANGVVWEIEVRAERQTGWGTLNRLSGDVAYYRYGLWSQDDGLVTRPLASHLDSEFFTQQCNLLIDRICERLPQLPFRLADNRELWLFDQAEQRPLALLASAIADSILPSPEPRYWSSCIGADGVPSQRRYPAATQLETLVRERAGFNINKRWIDRQDDGSGIFEASNSRLQADAFPVFLLSEDWPEAEQATLARGYIEWTAPSLLTLQNLGTDERTRLENSLNIQAESVEHHWHLYPEIIDENCVRAARVQCRLQKANQGGRTPQ
jgi:hypothetical protein